MLFPSTHILVLLLGLMISPQSACTVTFYANVDYAGTAYGPFSVGEYWWVADIGMANDQISSLKVSGTTAGCCVTLYRHSSFGGAHQEFCNEDVSYVGNGFNDEMSSFKLAVKAVAVYGEWIDTTWDVYPFMVSIFVNGQHSCGGSIFSLNGGYGNGVILTAAHCIAADLSSMDIYIGCTKSSCTNSGVQKYAVADYKTHENVHVSGGEIGEVKNDIGLIYLKTGITKANAIPVTLQPTMTIQDNDEVKLLGYWGKCGPQDPNCKGGSDTDTLEYTLVHYMTDTECDNIITAYDSKWAGFALGNEDFCVKDDIYDSNGKLTGTCRGDSGSPWLFNGKQIGLTAWNVFGCDPNIPSAATRVPTFYNWIQAWGNKRLFVVRAKWGIGYAAKISVEYDSAVQGHQKHESTISAGFTAYFRIPNDGKAIRVYVNAIWGEQVFSKYFANAAYVINCNIFDIWGTTLFTEYANTATGAKHCFE